MSFQNESHEGNQMQPTTDDQPTQKPREESPDLTKFKDMIEGQFKTIDEKLEESSNNNQKAMNDHQQALAADINKKNNE